VVGLAQALSRLNAWQGIVQRTVGAGATRAQYYLVLNDAVSIGTQVCDRSFVMVEMDGCQVVAGFGL
jgi:hypothetical protein